MQVKRTKSHTVRASARRFSLIAFLLTAATWTTIGQSQQSDSQRETRGSAIQAVRLSPEADEIAEEIGVARLLKRLERPPDGPPSNGSPISLEAITVRQEITEKVLSTSLDIDSVNAVIDSEIEQIRSIRSDLQANRDKAQNIINIASIVTGGAFGAVTSALQFKSSTVNLGNGIGVAGGAGSVLVSIIGINKQGGRRSLGDSPRMLARFFGRQPDATEAIPSIYPEEVWTYLNSTPPSQLKMQTRREQLIAKWRSEGRIKQEGSSKGERRLETMSGNLAQVHKLSISDLDDRVAMLLDVRARVSLMKRGLTEILGRLSTVRRDQ